MPEHNRNQEEEEEEEEPSFGKCKCANVADLKYFLVQIGCVVKVLPEHNSNQEEEEEEEPFFGKYRCAKVADLKYFLVQVGCVVKKGGSRSPLQPVMPGGARESR